MPISDKTIQELQRAVKPEVISVKGSEYVTGAVVLPPPSKRLADPLVVRSLSALVDYVSGNYDRDEIDGEPPPLIVIKSPTKVTVHGWLDQDRQRECILKAEAVYTNFVFGQWYAIEEFLILLQTQFADTEHKDLILQTLGTLADETSVTYEDDGVTQRVTAKTGVARMGSVALPRIATLRPYRTFHDVDRQPDGQFLLRLRRDEGRPPTVALFDADGQLWITDAIGLIKSFLETSIPAEKGRIIG